MEQEKPTAVVGGSFDPTHLGHLYLVHTVVQATAYRRFIFIPVARNNFKQEDAPPLEAEHRVAMLKLSIEAYRRWYPDDPPLEFIIEECEIKRGGISYTYDTVLYLYQHYAIEGRLALVMGDDLVNTLPQWYAYDKLKHLVSFVVIRRERETSLALHDAEVDVFYLENPLFKDSSTEIREACSKLKEGDSLPSEVALLMPKEVAAYVDANRLYRS